MKGGNSIPLKMLRSSVRDPKIRGFADAGSQLKR